MSTRWSRKWFVIKYLSFVRECRNFSDAVSFLTIRQDMRPRLWQIYSQTAIETRFLATAEVFGHNHPHNIWDEWIKCLLINIVIIKYTNVAYVKREKYNLQLPRQQRNSKEHCQKSETLASINKAANIRKCSFQVIRSKSPRTSQFRASFIEQST